MKTCPDCNGDGVVEKVRTMNNDAQRAVAVVSCRMTMTAKRK
jgi:predicted metal-binding protein